MTKKQPKKQTIKQRYNRLTKTQKILGILATIVILIILFIFGNILLNKYLDYRDEQRFLMIESDLEDLKNALNNDGNLSVSWVSLSYCDRSREKFVEGTVGCRVQLNAKMGVASESEVNSIIREVNSAIEEENIFTPQYDYRSLSFSPNFPTDLRPGAGGQNFDYKKEDMACGTVFEIKEEDPGVLHMSIACNDTARQEWFPDPS